MADLIIMSIAVGIMCVFVYDIGRDNGYISGWDDAIKTYEEEYERQRLINQITGNVK